MNTTAIHDLTPDEFQIQGQGQGNGNRTSSGGGGGGGSIGIGRLSEPIVIEKGKGELPNVSYEPLNVHPNPYLQGMVEIPSAAHPNALPSRDIPQNNLQYTQDEATLPNYIPPPASGRKVRFVDEFNDTHVEKFRQKKYRKRLFEDLWDQLQIPLLVALLFYCLTMPFFDHLFHGTLFHWAPVLFTQTTGEINTYGRALKAVLFGIAYAGVMMVVDFGNSI